MAKLKEMLQPINIKEDTISWVNNTRRRVPSEHCVLTFKDRVEKTDVLRQSHLLKGTKIWILEELTLNQLKAKESELKKMYESSKRRQMGGLPRRQIIQEFCTPKMVPSFSLDPP